MTEDEARRWLAERWPAAVERVEAFITLVREEAPRQNLIAASTLNQIWSRHVVDSAQLALLVPPSYKPWIDVGTGGGFPGVICAIIRPEEFILVEPRRRRVEFLTDAVSRLGMMSRIEILPVRIEAVTVVAGTISARAVSAISALLDNAWGCIDSSTHCVFPRGRIDQEDVAYARSKRRMTFHVEHSVTDPASEIAIFSNVHAR